MSGFMESIPWFVCMILLNISTICMQVFIVVPSSGWTTFSIVITSMAGVCLVFFLLKLIVSTIKEKW